MGGREGVSRPLMQKAKLLPDSAKGEGGEGVSGEAGGREGGRSQCQQVTEIT